MVRNVELPSAYGERKKNEKPDLTEHLRPLWVRERERGRERKLLPGQTPVPVLHPAYPKFFSMPWAPRLLDPADLLSCVLGAETHAALKQSMRPRGRLHCALLSCISDLNILTVAAAQAASRKYSVRSYVKPGA